MTKKKKRCFNCKGLVPVKPFIGFTLNYNEGTKYFDLYLCGHCSLGIPEGALVDFTDPSLNMIQQDSVEYVVILHQPKSIGATVVYVTTVLLTMNLKKRLPQKLNTT